jgi:hypothetical protein
VRQWGLDTSGGEPHQARGCELTDLLGTLLGPGVEPDEEVRGVNELVTAKATPQEVGAFRRWLVAAAQAAADAAREGGFLGFGAEQVSAGEQQMLEQVRAALGVA